MAESFRDLIVWRKSVELAVEVHEVVGRFPGAERFRLGDQIIRAAVSVPANIAEGSGRRSPSDYVRFLSIARGSLFEVETMLLVAERVGCVRGAELEVVRGLATEVGKMLTVMMRRIRTRRPPGSHVA
jgi:four helix bundle protein